MQVDISNTQEFIPIESEQVRLIAQAVIHHEGQSCDEVSINFVDKEDIGNLHAQYFDDPSTTDCISFPIDDESETDYRVLGEVFVCPEVADDYCKQNGGSTLREVTLYVVHGLLHCMGYDDIDIVDREAMRVAEARHMANLDDKGLCL